MNTEKEYDGSIVNVVSTFGLMFEDYRGNRKELHLNLPKIAIYLRFLGISYNPMTLAALRMRMKLGSSRTTTLLFSSGKAVQAGALSEIQALEDAWYSAMLFSKVFGNIPVMVDNFRITNMVYRLYLGYQVDLWKLDASLGPRSIYTPEKSPDAFPACRIREVVGEKKCQVWLVYRSGRVVITGAKTWEEIKLMIEKIIMLCADFKLDKSKLTILDENSYRLEDRNEYSSKENIKILNDELKLLFNDHESRPNVNATMQLLYSRENELFLEDIY